MTVRWRGVLVVAVAVAMAMAGGACGSSSKQAATTTTSTTVKKQDIAGDKAAAVAANLVLSDFPAGWTSKPQDNSPDTETADQEAAKCIGISVEQLDNTGPTDSESPDFSSPDDTTTISSSIGFVAESAQGSQDFDVLVRPQVAGCLSNLLAAVLKDETEHPADPADALPPGVSIGTPTVTKQPAPPGVGDKAVEYRVSMLIKGPRISIPVTVDLLFVLKGRAEVTMSFEGLGKAVPADQQAHYTGVVTARITRV